MTHQERVGTVAFHPAEPVVLTGSDDGSLRFWSADTGESLRHAFYHDARLLSSK